MPATLHALQADITTLAVDAIANAANSTLLGGEPELLASCYWRSIEVAAAAGARTIAFPAIGTGVYGYPLEPAARIAVATVRRAAGDVKAVTFCCFSASDLAVYEALLR
ncbi:MAG: macro domain-containing protein [Burkholderiales bacterium]